MLYKRKPIGYVVVFSLLTSMLLYSCHRPLFVTHWSDKGHALIKKKGYGRPNHSVLAYVICTNKMCLSKAERENRWATKRFKGFKNKRPTAPTQEPAIPRKDSSVFIEEQIVWNTTKIFTKVQFEADSSTLLNSSYGELDELITLLNDQPTLKVAIIGHTDSIGTEAYNQQLSFERAQAVAKYLVKNSILKSRITNKGAGEEYPIADNGSEKGRFMNRRVEYIIYE